MITTIVIFFIVNVILAFIDSRRIRDKKTITHWLNGLVYLVLVGIAFWVNEFNWWMVSALLLERLIFFQTALSLMRKLKWDYITTDPKSLTDKIQVAIFGKNGIVMYSVYAVLFIINLIILFL